MEWLVFDILLMDFKKLTTRYHQFGGIRLVWQYTKLGVLPVVVKGFFRCLYKRKSFKVIYPEVLKRVEPFLITKYGSRVQEFKKFNSLRELKHEHPKVIWWCWLQGKEQAPPIVKACYNSLVQEFKSSGVQEAQGLNEEYEIKVIDAENWKEYVELPDYVVKKWEKNQIPPALFSDLLRLELLIKYGGTWIDSTVLCTGNVNDNHNENFLNADLFVFQYTRPGEKWSGNISNWFISAHSNNEVLMTLRDMLFAYWKDYNCTLDYYIFHLFFSIVAKEYPEQIAAMPYGYSVWSIALMHHLGDTFNKKQWDKLVSKVCFHKLAFRLSDDIKNNKDNYYNYLLKSQTNEYATRSI